MTRKNCFNFGEDPNLDLETIVISFLTDASPLRDGAKNDIAQYLKNLRTYSN